MPHQTKQPVILRPEHLDAHLYFNTHHDLLLNLTKSIQCPNYIQQGFTYTVYLHVYYTVWCDSLIPFLYKHNNLLRPFVMFQRDIASTRSSSTLLCSVQLG